MTVTTVKVDTAVRDRLLAEARREGSTVGQLLDAMLAERERTQRFVHLAQAMAATPANGRESWQAEADAWDASSADGLAGT